MLIIYLVVAAAVAAGLADAVVVRVCVTGDGMEACGELRRDPLGAAISVQCVHGPDRYGCLQKLAAKEVDVAAASGEDVFLAREMYDMQLQVVAETRARDRRDDTWRYQGLAVVRRSKITKLSDLRGSRSCHTGYGRTAGWNIPFSHLLQKGLVTMQCDSEATVVEHDVRAAAAFFGMACIPGAWVPDNATDAALKKKYKNLCAMCGQPDVCDSQDSRAGYKGALDCLVDAHGDVAWTKLSATQEFFKGRADAVISDYGLLCPDGRVLDLDLSASPKQCNWASRPWNSWLVRAANENKKAIISTLTKMMEAATPPAELRQDLRPWAKDVLGVKEPSVIHPRSPPVSPHDYLKEHKYDTTIERLGCPETPVKLCVDSSHAMAKCTGLSYVLRSRRVRPQLECVMPPANDDCLAMVASGGAHIITADGGDVYKANKEYSLVPVVSERYGLQDASYFAVAVVKANSSITSLSQLEGKRSCHTGMGRTAGWKIPVVTLLEAGLLQQGDCNFAGQLGNFFSASCVPGAKDPQYDPDSTNPTSLCDLCIGSDVEGVGGPAYTGTKGEGKCERKPVEAFYGYTGAFRCLVQGGGDVAFIKHTTVGDNTNGNNNAPWAANLRSVDFKLLCRNTGSADVVDYNTCHLARVPAHQVLIKHDLTPTMKEEVRILLLSASGKLPQGQDVFPMFGSFMGNQDLIFKDSATELVNVRMDEFHSSLKDSYFRTLAKMDNCIPIRTSPVVKYLGGAGVPSLPFLYLVLCVALTLLRTH